MINFFSEDAPFPLTGKKLATEAKIKRMIRMEGKKTGDLNFVFCSDDYLLNINRQYLQHDYYTDVITFDYCQGNNISGDIYISIDRVAENAQHYGFSFDAELYRVILHGVLHLCGYGDKTNEEQTLMRAKEDCYLTQTLPPH